MENQLEQIRMRHRMRKYSSESWEDIGHLLSLLDRREMQKPDALAYLRECLNNNKYPATSDMIAVIDELEASRANHIKDLEEIDDWLSTMISECEFTRFVQTRLKWLRDQGQPTTIDILATTIGILDGLILSLDIRIASAPAGARAAGLREAARIIRNKRTELYRQVNDNDES